MPKRTTNYPQAPLLGSKGFIRVLARGCLGWKDEYHGDYVWECERCPIVIAEETFVGPPERVDDPLSDFLELAHGLHSLTGSKLLDDR